MRRDPLDGTSAYVLETGAEAEKRGRGRPSLKPARDAAKAAQQVRELAELAGIRAEECLSDLIAKRRELAKAAALDEGRGTMAPPSGFYGLGAPTPQQQAKYNRRGSQDARRKERRPR